MVDFSKKGKAYHVNSWDVIDRRKAKRDITCTECGEIMYQKDRDEIACYIVVIYECRNGHEREMFIEKEV